MEIVDQPNTFNRPMPKLRGIALPTEHGGWGFLLEPLVGGLFVAFSPAAPYIALLMIGAFLTRQPLKVLSGDLLARRDLPQTRIAAKFVVGYGALALVGLVGMLYFAPAAAFLPLVAVSPLAAAQIFADSKRKSRTLLAEISGGIAISCSAAAFALADGWSLPMALLLWSIFAARIITAIFYVRNRLLLEKGKENSFVIPVTVHIMAFAASLVFALLKFSPFLVAAMFVVLTVRCAIGLSGYRRRVKAVKIGIAEVIYGTIFTVSVALSFMFNV